MESELKIHNKVMNYMLTTRVKNTMAINVITKKLIPMNIDIQRVVAPINIL